MFLITTIYLFNSFKQLGRKKNPKNSFTTITSDVCHKIQTKQAMCEIGVRPFQDRTAKRQAKSLRGSRPTCQMVVWGSPGGRDWPYPAGWSLETRKTKKEGKGEGKRGRSSKTVVKIQKGTGIRTTEDPRQKSIALQ